MQRAELLQHGDDPAIEPGQLMVRVFIPPPDGPEDPQDYEQALAAWQDTHRTGMDALRRELSLRLPAARLLEFTFEDPGVAANQGPMPRITLPDDGSLAAEQMSGREIVTTALSLLRANYVFPELAEQAATAIEARLEAGEYDHLDEITLTELLTSQLQEICEDKHLRLRLGGRRTGPGPADQARAARALVMDRTRMDLRITRPGGWPCARSAGWTTSASAGSSGWTATSATSTCTGSPSRPTRTRPSRRRWSWSAGTYALIIDLRHNGGGSPEGVVFWCSYLFDEQPTHFNDIFRADTGETKQFWALSYEPGTRYVDRPVYVLTSSRTFSGGEDFCYTLQALGRAQVIGETTGGGAHPTRPFPISAAVHIAIPFARSVNPVTGTNWQGTGVVPDIAVPQAEAYDVAYGQALRHVLAMEDLIPPIADQARDALAGLPAADQG